MSGVIGGAGSRSGTIGETEIDYEEGIWTGVFSGASNACTMNGSYTTGTYTKIGNMVIVTGFFVNNSLGSASGNMYLTGLPFTCANAGDAYAGVAVGMFGDLAITAGHSVSGAVEINTTRMRLQLSDATTGTTYLQHTELSANGSMMISGTYRVA